MLYLYLYLFCDRKNDEAQGARCQKFLILSLVLLYFHVSDASIFFIVNVELIDASQIIQCVFYFVLSSSCMDGIDGMDGMDGMEE